MIILLYVIIILIATISGAITGLGGGVIIKPLFDIIGYHDASSIGFYSSFAVFTMCIVSIYKQIRNGFNFKFNMLLTISFGSAVGGILGEKAFSVATSILENNIVKIIQSSLLGITLLCILLYTLNKAKIKHYNIENLLIIFSLGAFLGAISIFLGIGGGPLNVALMMYLFYFSMKEASIYSIATIFFSQISKLMIVFIEGKIANFDLKFIPFIIVSAIIGGWIGTVINQKLKSRSIERLYNLLMIILLCISIYNITVNI